MDFSKFDRQLRLMVSLAQNTTLSVSDIAEKLNLSRRSIYRYIETFKEMGFKVEHSGDIYRLDKSSRFFRDISDNILFTEDEALTIAQTLSSVSDKSTQVKNLQAKLARLYNYRVLDAHDVDTNLSRKISNLYEAIKQHRVVVLKGYHSLRSGKVSDRSVEPFQFLNNNDDIRCYELSSRSNKTFKLSRIDAVELLDIKWTCVDHHENLTTDLFGYTDKVLGIVKLRLDETAAHILVEDYPNAKKQLQKNNDGTFLLTTEVCNYNGIGRFFIGLAKHIDIVNSPDFENFIKETIKDLTQKFNL